VKTGVVFYVFVCLHIYVYVDKQVETITKQ